MTRLTARNVRKLIEVEADLQRKADPATKSVRRPWSFELAPMVRALNADPLIDTILAGHGWSAQEYVETLMTVVTVATHLAVMDPARAALHDDARSPEETENLGFVRDPPEEVRRSPRNRCPVAVHSSGKGSWPTGNSSHVSSPHTRSRTQPDSAD